jgi:hypothetical protein
VVDDPNVGHVGEDVKLYVAAVGGDSLGETKGVPE